MRLHHSSAEPAGKLPPPKAGQAAIAGSAGKTARTLIQTALAVNSRDEPSLAQNQVLRSYVMTDKSEAFAKRSSGGARRLSMANKSPDILELRGALRVYLTAGGRP
jgi:hypothetical protein